MTVENNDLTDTRQTAALILRNEGVDWAQLEAEGRSKAVFQKFVEWVGAQTPRGVRGRRRAPAERQDGAPQGSGLVIDGPFAEGREAVLGFILVRVKDVDEACAIAGESPHAEIGGTMEVRMVSAFPKP